MPKKMKGCSFGKSLIFCPKKHLWCSLSLTSASHHRVLHFVVFLMSFLMAYCTVHRLLIVYIDQPTALERDQYRMRSLLKLFLSFVLIWTLIRDETWRPRNDRINLRTVHIDTLGPPLWTRHNLFYHRKITIFRMGKLEKRHLGQLITEFGIDRIYKFICRRICWKRCWHKCW